jgi:hypothetical protein
MIKFLGERNSARLLTYANNYFPVVCAAVLLPGGLRSCTTTSYYFSMDVCGTALLPFFLHQLTINYFKYLNMSTIGNGTAGACGTGPVSGYNMTLSHLFIVFVMFVYRLSASMNNFYAAIILLILNNSMIYLMNFKFKIYHKIPKILTCTTPFFVTVHFVTAYWRNEHGTLVFLRVGSHGKCWNSVQQEVKIPIAELLKSPPSIPKCLSSLTF